VVASEPTYVVNEVEGAAPSEPVASVPQPEVVASEPVNVNTEPAGLFSPVTGFGWEAYLKERLDSELIRSASSEEDIGLMIVRIQGIDRTDQRNKAIYNKLLEIYKFRDLIFEYGSDGFSCIVHSVNVDSALDLAEQVYVALSKILKENGMDNEIGIGISTRSFRLIPGKRIFEEAEQALIRAFTDPETAIVAFRVDPEKYRQYISNYIDQEE
jgi:GGDEF domain-containing protein